MIQQNRFRNGPMPIGFKAPADLKPYNIVTNDDDSAEINMYGEVVSEIPTNFWTGERIEGLYIVLSDFLNDMETLKNKANVTFHINSPGGEVFAGVAIYNRMKEFTGNVTTIVDGLAASAASIIAQGGKTRKVCNGTLTMIHGASSFMFGYYNAHDMKDALAQINAIDKSIAEIYAKCTGMEQEKIKNMMAKTTWMSAQEAVDNGFADEIVENGEKVTMSLNSSKSLLTVNGVPMSARGLFNLPDSIPVNQVTPGNEPDVINKNEPTGGMEKMTLEELMQSEPELVNQIRNDAIQSVQNTVATSINDAVSAELTRLQSIDEIADKIGDKELINRAKYGDVKMSAGDLALEALKAQKDAGSAFLNNMQQDAKDSGATGVEPVPQSGSEDEQVKNDIAAGAALIAGITPDVK